MALDNAEFIAELSIADPPGTDPLNQGDDHIRTTKKAVQQSFPNVDAAVPQSAAQMAQMAIKNELNTFTQNQTFQGQILAAGGTELLPGWSFSGAPSNGWRNVAAGVMALSTLGIERFRVSDTQTRTRVPHRGVSGSAAAPTYSFESSADMGMFRLSSAGIGFAVAGATNMQLITPGLLQMSDGTAARPSHAFISADNMGWYRNAAFGDMRGSVGGVDRLIVDSAGLQIEQGLVVAGNATFNGTTNLAFDDRWKFQASVEPPATSRVGFGIRNSSGQVQWETYRTNGPSFNYNLCQRRIAGVFQDNPITIRNADGGIVMVTLPTTNPGVNGMLWKSGGFVAISSG